MYGFENYFTFVVSNPYFCKLLIKNLVNVVFPTPISPIKKMQSPFSNFFEIDLDIRFKWSKDLTIISYC